MEAEDLISRAGERGAVLRAGLEALAAGHPAITNARGRGLFCAIDLPDTATRDAVISHLFRAEHAFVLGCGTRSIRLRPSLTVTEEDLADGLARLERAVTAVTG